jgi:DNA-binding CsgD family transcriptional regulator
VLHIELALYVVTFSLGVTVLILCLMAYARYERLTFLDLSALICGILLLLIDGMVKTYDRTANAGLAVLSPVFHAVISGLGYGLLACMIPLFSHRVVLRPVPGWLMAVFCGISAGIGGLAVLTELTSIPALTTVTSLAFVVVQVYGVFIIRTRLDGLTRPRLKAHMRAFTLIVMLGVLAISTERVVRILVVVPEWYRDFYFTDLVYVLSAGSVFLSYVFQDLFKVDVDSNSALTEPFAQKYGISPRESQIVSMMIKGYSNRRIGEELFISSITVKNHIYHIYQKTGVGNKVQLMNLVKPTK